PGRRVDVLLGAAVPEPRGPRAAEAFATAAPGGLPAVSWADMSLEADHENGLFYGVETLARKVAAFRITESGITTVWKKTQTTTECTTTNSARKEKVAIQRSDHWPFKWIRILFRCWKDHKPYDEVMYHCVVEAHRAKQERVVPLVDLQ